MNASGKSRAALFLQACIVFIGFGAVVFLLWEPHLEGRNVRATNFEIYFKDPFLVYVYMGSIPVFVALRRAFVLCGHFRRIGSFTQVTVDGLRVIRHCGLALVAFVAVGALFILMLRNGEGRPEGLFMSVLFGSAAGGIAIAAGRFSRHLEDL